MVIGLFENVKIRKNIEKISSWYLRVNHGADWGDG